LTRLLLAGLLVILSAACGDVATTITSDATGIATLDNSPRASGSITPAPGATLVDARFVRIVDGDTIIVRLGGSDERVRLIGINTPELNKPDGPVECYATEASKQTEALIDDANGAIQLERDVSETDQYGRLLRYVWLVTPQGKQLLNEELVAGGFARSISYRPDIKYQSTLNRDQNDARNHGRGLWGACK
jgi:micrococcal nuclease